MIDCATFILKNNTPVIVIQNKNSLGSRFLARICFAQRQSYRIPIADIQKTAEKTEEAI